MQWNVSYELWVVSSAYFHKLFYVSDFVSVIGVPTEHLTIIIIHALLAPCCLST